MKQVVIVEDEILAAKRLEKLLSQLDENVEVLAILDSVKNAAKWLANNPTPDLLFLDIQLGDGLSFEIFDIVQANCPIIFVTAFNEYAIDAFKLNSVAYLLKPIVEEDLRNALAKYDNMHSLFNKAEANEQIQQARKSLQEGYKQRFMVKAGAHIRAVTIAEICYFYSQDKATFIKTNDGRSNLIDYTIEQLEELVDPKEFFRINRKYLVSLTCIEDIIAYSNSRLQLKLRNQIDKDAIVSRQKVTAFKQWLDA